METIVVTRHPALVEYLTEIGLLPNGVTVLIVTRCPAFLERQSTPLPGGLDDVGGAP